ncbi:hypothetical protein [Nesterenkonia haasae]|uniref:hypothetical protein n=1 Tax=Nesterenkonia haasae TaxID=2587813 RepID=UPI001391A403|nr:hypothetical protein [Nesterenkonia haasae]NDK33023.1 hypothetical protein [Nesterenkonia haasae]
MTINSDSDPFTGLHTSAIGELGDLGDLREWSTTDGSGLCVELGYHEDLETPDAAQKLAERLRWGADRIERASLARWGW